MAKTKLTNEFIADFNRALALGLTNKAACDYCGISEPTLYSYINKGEQDFNNDKNTMEAKFFKSLKKSRADFRLFHLIKIRDAAEHGSWQASAWTLERCCPDEYGKVVKSDSDNGILPELLRKIEERKKVDE